MQSLTPIRPRFARLWSLNPSSLSIRTLSPRAFSSSSSSDYSNQSRGGLPRFFSELLPTSKELGASSLTPLLTERSPTVSENRLDRLQRVNMAAAKQCQRLHEMILNPPKNINGLLPLVAESKLAFLAVAEGTPLVSALTSSGTESSVLIVVGPEGRENASRFSIIPCVKRKEEKEGRKRSFLKNGSILLEDLIASCDGKSHPIRCYSAAELIRATNNFDPSCMVGRLPSANMYRGILDDRTVIIRKYGRWVEVDEAIRDIIISMQMSTHKNSLKLLGCCLEFDRPALVLENAGKGGLNSDGSLVVDAELLPWKTRLCIAKQLASALTYLHTAFPRPIVHRNLESTHILLDDDYVPKLFDFSFSITIPPDQLYVQENFATFTLGYLDPAYRKSYQISEKNDVYCFGVLLLVFLMRREAISWTEEGNVGEYLTEDPKLNVSDGQIQIETIADPKILEEVGGDEQAQQQLQDFLALALLCIQEETEARPDMIDVAKELVRIDKSILP